MNNEHRQTTSVDVGVPTCTLSVCIASRPCVRSDARAPSPAQPAGRPTSTASRSSARRRRRHTVSTYIHTPLASRVLPPNSISGKNAPRPSFPAPRPHLHVTSKYHRMHNPATSPPSVHVLPDSPPQPLAPALTIDIPARSASPPAIHHTGSWQRTLAGRPRSAEGNAAPETGLARRTRGSTPSC